MSETTPRLRLQHVILQPVFVIDDGEELHRGPQVAPVSLPLSRIAEWAAAMPAEIDRLREEFAEQQARPPADGPSPT